MYKGLRDSLEAVEPRALDIIAEHFPERGSKAMKLLTGGKMSDEFIAERCAQLNAWMRALLQHFLPLSLDSQMLFIDFFSLDPHNEVDGLVVGMLEEGEICNVASASTTTTAAPPKKINEAIFGSDSKNRTTLGNGKGGGDDRGSVDSRSTPPPAAAAAPAAPASSSSHHFTPAPPRGDLLAVQVVRGPDFEGHPVYEASLSFSPHYPPIKIKGQYKVKDYVRLSPNTIQQFSSLLSSYTHTEGL